MYGQLGVVVSRIPYLKSLEQDYHEQNIVFLSVSVDTNKDKWLKGWRRSIRWGAIMGRWLESNNKRLCYFGIPRFTFSEDGKVISNDAPRPSNEH